MLNYAKEKWVHIGAAEAAVDDASLTTASVDLKGWDYCTVAVHLGTTDIAMTALKIQQSDDDGNSDAYADVTGLVYGTSADAYTGSTSSLPAADDDGNWYLFDIDCRKVDRYIDLVCTFGDGTTGGFAYALAILSRGEVHTSTAAGRGVESVLRI